ncbi:MAG: hypothetical protein ACOX5Y_00205 [Acholeplasmataceae bacterium]|jgi:hypothetical protein
MSNNGFIIYKKCNFFSFINKCLLSLLMVLLLFILFFSYYYIFKFWVEIPLVVKIVSPIILVLFLVGIIFIPLNGMIVTKKGNIYFIPDFRIIKIKLEDLKRIAFNFNEWEKNKYSVMVKFVYKNGRTFVKDYSKQFQNMKNNKIAMSIYTIKKAKVEKICENLLNVTIATSTIIDKNDNIIYQNKL